MRFETPAQIEIVKSGCSIVFWTGPDYEGPTLLGLIIWSLTGYLRGSASLLAAEDRLRKWLRDYGYTFPLEESPESLPFGRTVARFTICLDTGEFSWKIKYAGTSTFKMHTLAQFFSLCANHFAELSVATGKAETGTLQKREIENETS